MPHVLNPALERPIFITGSTRSGTTLLGILLDHHPSIGIAGELDWIFDFESETRLPSVDADREWLQMHRAFRVYDLHVDAQLDGQDIPRDLLRQMALQHAPHKPQAGVQLHKHYARFAALWPQARFLHLVRDGRDVSSSWLRLGWQGNTWAAAHAWCDLLRQWAEICETIPSDQRLELRFEDLIANPTRELQSICAFLGVPYDPRMLEFPRDTSYGPIDAREAGKWRSQLTKRQVAVFESVAGTELMKWGYPLSEEPKLRIGVVRGALLSAQNRVAKNRARRREFGTALFLGDHLTRRVGPRNFRALVQLRMDAITNAKMK